MLLTTDDFTDKYELSTGMYDTMKLQSYIQKYEERYLVHLLGASLYNDFISDLDNNVPRSIDFQNIFNPFNEDLTSYVGVYGLYESGYGNRILESEGIIELLKGFIYFEYAKDLMNQQTPYGNVKQRAENSVVVDSPHSLIYGRYNEAIKTYRAIQEYIRIHRTDNILGALITITMVQPGTLITSGVYDATGGSGTGAKLEITSDGGGTVLSVAIDSAGSGYAVGDELSVDAGNNDLIVSVDYVSIGDYSKWNGLRKSMAYWI